MKKKIVKILLILIMILSVIPIYPKAEESAKKGDLRCPKTSNGNKYCKEYKDSNGKVYKTEVTVSDKSSNVKVTKIVEKTEKVGQFAVHFKVEGNTTPAPPNGYVVILYDTSGSQKDLMDGEKGTKAGITRFSELLVNKEYQFALVQFATNKCILSTQNKFLSRVLNPKTDFCPHEDDPPSKKWGIGGYSRIDVGLKAADTLLKNIDADIPKYVVIFGDGEYMFYPNTHWNYNELDQYHNSLGNMKNNYFYGIRYPSSSTTTGGTKKMSEGGYNFCKTLADYASHCSKQKGTMYMEKGVNKINFDIAIMNYLAHVSEGKGEVIEANTSDFIETFEKAFSAIDAESKKYSFAGTLEDKVDNSFTISNPKSTSRTIRKPIKNLPYSTSIEDYYYISIDNESETRWHATNDGFKFRYSYDGINYIDVSSNVNPEVYWEQEKGWQSCSDYASSSSDSSYVNDYIERTCSQIDGDGMRGFYALLTTNGKPINTKMISLTSGTGFPLTVDIESRVQCTYKFNVDNFNNKLQEISNAKNSYEKASKTKELIQNVESYVNSSLKLDNLQKYQKSLDTLDAVLQVKFKSSTKDIKLQSSSPSINEIKCSSDTPDKSITIDGKRYDVYTNRNCVLKYKKSLNIPTHCLSMYNGNMEECSATANNLINGGNKFYPDTNETSGYISVTLKNATYAGSTINLKGEKKSDGKNYDCQLSLSPIKPVIYRQIQLNDPFVQSYTKNQRSIGKNWINSNYNFVNIIKSDIWDSSKKYDYQYLMSKVDVENIKKDTKEIGIKSYLGRNCSFNSNNKYVCEFVRPNSSGKNQFFTKISGNALNISNE